MTYLKQPGGTVFVSDAINFTGDSRPHLVVAVSKETIAQKARRGLSVHLGQLYGIVNPGLIMTRHVFQGLKRPMQVGDDPDADGKKLAFTWSPKFDARLVGGPTNPQIERLPPPEARAFAVYITPNKVLSDFPDVFGWAEHWTWVSADPQKSDAPIDWDTRFERKLWSNSD